MQALFANHAATPARPARHLPAAALPALTVTYSRIAASRIAPAATSKITMDSYAAPAPLAAPNVSTRQATALPARAATITSTIPVFLPALRGTSAIQG